MSERTHLFFKEGKLYLIPELPTEQHNLHLPVEIEKAKANALPVVNPEVADNTELPFPGNRIVRLRKENENFEWPGTWEKVREIFVVNKKSHTKTFAKLIAPQQPQAEDWQATPKKKKPLDEKLNSLSLKLKDISHAKRVIKDEKGLPIGFEPFNKTLMTQSDAPNEGREEIKKAPNQRCSLDGEKVIPCFIMDGDGCVDYSGRCFGCGDKMVITTDEQNQTEYDAARAYLIKEGLDPDQLAKDGTVFIKAIHEQISLRDQLSKEREIRKELVENAIATLCSKFPEYGNREFSVREIRALLEPLKASELDKNN